MSKKVTPWFPPSIKPVHIGAYKTNNGRLGFSYWNGLAWGVQSSSPLTAHIYKTTRGATQDKQWRGLAVKP